jgi:cytochrome c2
MRASTLGTGLLVSFTLAAVAGAQESDLAAGEKLYTSQCKICHGSVTASQTGERAQPQHLPVRLAMGHGGSTSTDVTLPITDGLATATGISPVAGTAPDTRIAFAPPFGPNLRGVYGRPAGSVPSFEYSSTFLKMLKGMEWNDAALDVWITNPQTWVPGVYMYYKQPDAEVRRKIILYLKANP